MAYLLARCCCCVPLRTGSLVIGIVLLVLHGLQVLGCALLLAGALVADGMDTEAVLITAGVLLGISACWLLFDALLVRGVAAEKPGLMMAWLCWAYVMLSIDSVYVCAMLYFAIATGDPGAIIYAVIAFIMNMVQWHWVHVIRCYLRVMALTLVARQEQQQERQQQQQLQLQQQQYPLQLQCQPGYPQQQQQYPQQQQQWHQQYSQQQHQQYPRQQLQQQEEEQQQQQQQQQWRKRYHEQHVEEEEEDQYPEQQDQWRQERHQHQQQRREPVQRY